METVKGPDSLDEKLERMVTAYQHDLLRLCYAYLHDEELAKDALQETFLKAYRGLPSFKTIAPKKPGLHELPSIPARIYAAPPGFAISREM